MVAVSQRPRLIRVKVGVSSDAGAWEVGVGQEAPLPVERGAVAVETGGEEDDDVGVFPVVLHVRVWDLLSGSEGGILSTVTAGIILESFIFIFMNNKKMWKCIETIEKESPSTNFYIKPAQKNKGNTSATQCNSKSITLL